MFLVTSGRSSSLADHSHGHTGKAFRRSSGRRKTEPVGSQYRIDGGAV